MKLPVPLYTVTGIHRGGKRESLSLPCSRLKAIELRDWTRRVLGNVRVRFVLKKKPWVVTIEAKRHGH